VGVKLGSSHSGSNRCAEVLQNTVLRKTFLPRRDKVTVNGGNCRPTIIIFTHQKLSGDQIKKNEMGGTCVACGGGCFNGEILSGRATWKT